MSDQPDSQEMVLDEFLLSTTRSFDEAQKSMLEGSGISVSMMLSSAELEVKVAVENVKGCMMVRPISLRDITQGKIDPGMLSTVRINYIGSVDELEHAVPSEVVTPSPGSVSNETPVKRRVPDLAGFTLKAAKAKLEKNDWKFVAHAATRDEIATAEKDSHGKVIRQNPQPIEASGAETIHFWVNLGSIPVQAIDGIGEKMELNLSEVGIRSLGDLSLADVSELSSFLHMNERRTRDFVNMASMMSRLVVLGLADEIAELLIKGAKIHSVEALAEADPEKLHQICSRALADGEIRSPKKFSITKKEVKEWINAAKRTL